MRSKLIAAISCCAMAFSAPVSAQSADEDLTRLTDAYQDWIVETYGLVEEASGATRPAGSLPVVTAAAEQARAGRAREFLAQAGAIDRAALSDGAKIDLAVLETLLRERIGDAEFREWEMPLNSDSNFWTYLASPNGFQTVADYELYIARMRDLPRYFGEHITNMRAGLARGFSVPAVTLEGRDVSIGAYVVEDPESSPFWSAFNRMPERFSDEDRARLMTDGRDAIAASVTPAYTNLLDFFRTEYLPQARTSLGASEFPSGAAYYQQQIRQYTTLDMTAEEIHRIGLDEVSRITEAMEVVKAEAGFEGSLPDFITFLRTDPQFVARTPDELMGVAAYTAKRVDDALGEYFGFLPRYRHGIRPVDPAIAPFYTAGRGGLEYCQINTHDLPSRPVYNIPALTVHECAPGHSFQAAIALEREEAPRFRRQTYFSGFGEGWGLYTEYLGNEMGIYRTPYERFGQLSYEMWRAARLVIDTGLHHYGWTREQAVEYLAARTALSEREVGTEIDRYISWPGQALAYKLGELTIRRTRAKAESALGDEFDIRKFHDVLLSLGSVPLPVFEARIDAFIADGGPGLAGRQLRLGSPRLPP